MPTLSRADISKLSVIVGIRKYRNTSGIIVINLLANNMRISRERILDCDQLPRPPCLPHQLQLLSSTLWFREFDIKIREAWRKNFRAKFWIIFFFFSVLFVIVFQFCETFSSYKKSFDFTILLLLLPIILTKKKIYPFVKFVYKLFFENMNSNNIDEGI